MYARYVLGFLVMCIYIYIYIYILSIFRTRSHGPLFHGFVGRTRIIARCFWAFYDFVLTRFYDYACAYDHACVCDV